MAGTQRNHRGLYKPDVRGFLHPAFAESVALGFAGSCATGPGLFASEAASFITGLDLILSGGAELGYGTQIPTSV